MSPLVQLKNRLAGDRKLMIAFSGGLDSTVLLHQLTLLRQQLAELQLRAIHIHHGLSQDADSWVQHCRALCAAWQVPLVVERVTIDGRKDGVEAAAREARYQAFRQHLLPGETLVTGQHQDDQCETFLLALKRGSGPAGLAAMPVRQRLGDHIFLRPLLTQRRDELEAWARQHRLSWIEDGSNQDTRYDRNFLRQEILPQLSQRWPHFSRAVARSAALCGEQEQLLDELLAETLAAIMQPDGALCTAPLMQMSESRRAALLRRWIAARGGQMPSREAIRRLYPEVICARADASPSLRLGNHEIRRYRQALYWLPLHASLRNVVLLWPAPWAPLLLPEGAGQLIVDKCGTKIRRPLADETVSVRFYARGDQRIIGRLGHRPMKKIWQELGIPPWQRERSPLIFYNETLIAAPGIFVSHAGAVAEPADAGWCICWQQ